MIQFYVNGEIQKTDREAMPVGEILKMAGFVPINKFCLHDQCVPKDYKDYLENIELYEGKALLALSTGPTPTA